MFGAIIPEPFAIPPIVTRTPLQSNSRACSLTNVSVVIIASAAAPPPSCERNAAASFIPSVIVPMGRNCPITPVDETSTSSRPTSSAEAVAPTIAQASSKPRSPVHALAFPLFTTIARNTRERPICSRVTRTGAAWTLFVVRTTAAEAGTSDTRRQRSFFDFLTPQWMPTARNPFGAVMPPGRPCMP